MARYSGTPLSKKLGINTTTALVMLSAWRAQSATGGKNLDILYAEMLPPSGRGALRPLHEQRDRL